MRCRSSSSARLTARCSLTTVDAVNTAPPRLAAGRRVLAFAALSVLLVAIAFAIWQAAFSTFATYDDEGYVLISLRGFLSGSALYDEVYTQYGPAFFLVEGTLHRVTGLGLDARGARFKAVVALTLFAAAMAALSWWLTRRWWAGLLAAAVTHTLLEKLVLEPGHPQELCLLLAAAAVLVAARASNRGIAASWGAVGVLAVSLAFVKPNIGGLATLSLATAAAWQLPRRGVGRAARLAAATLAVTIPWLLMGRGLLQSLVASGPSPGSPFVSLGFVVSLGVVACLVVAARSSVTDTSTWQPLGWLVGCGAATAFALAAASLMWCTSAAGLYDGLIGQHLSFGNRFLETPLLPRGAWLVGVVGMVCAALWGRAPRTQQGQERLAVSKLLAGVALVGTPLVAGLATAAQPLVSGLEDPAAAGLILAGGPSLVWLLLLPRASGRSEADERPRLALALVALLQPLGAFPMAGGQLAIGAAWLAVVGVVLIGDGLGGLSAAAQRILPVPLVALAVIAAGGHALSRWQLRESLEPLGLPGTAGLRVPLGQAQLLRWVTAELPRHGETFVAFPQARNSFYLWTGLEPPTGLNASYWPLMLDNSQQRRVLDALKQRQRVAVLWDRSEDVDRLVAAATPLVAYLATEFVPIRSLPQLEIRVRRGATVVGEEGRVER
jgi:hypothetical protein